MALGDLISPNAEEWLSAIPSLLGAYESAKGKPIGAILSGLGGLGTQHATERLAGTDVSALQKLLGSIPQQQAPVAYQQYQTLQPMLDKMTPTQALKEMEKIQQTATGEETKFSAEKPPLFYNMKTGKMEYHRPTEFQGGNVPPDLVPWGGTAGKMLAQKLNLPSTETQGREMWDTVAQAQYGMPFEQLRQQNPKAAQDVITKTAAITAQPRADIEYAKELALLSPRSDTAIQQAVKERGQIPHGKFEQDVYDQYGKTPEQYQALSPDERGKIYNDIVAKEAREQALKSGLSATERGKAVNALAIDSWLSKPIMASGKYVAVDPKTFAKTAGPEETFKTWYGKGGGTISKSLEQQYDQGVSALKGFDQMQAAGEKVLPDTGSYLLTNEKIRALDVWGNQDARTYRTSSLSLIPALRNITGTSRPNQQELKTAIQGLQNIGNKHQLKGALDYARKAIRDNLNEMIQRGKAGALSDATETGKDAAIKAAETPTPETPEAPESESTPGYSVSY